MSFTVFSYNATVLLIQPNPTQPMDGPPTHVHLCATSYSVTQKSAIHATVNQKLQLHRRPHTFTKYVLFSFFSVFTL